MADDDDYNDLDMGYEDEPPEPEIEEGLEDEMDNNNNEDVPDPPETQGKGEQEPVERPRKTSKHMTKYERARILGTGVLQIRSLIAMKELERGKYHSPSAATFQMEVMRIGELMSSSWKIPGRGKLGVIDTLPCLN